MASINPCCCISVKTGSELIAILEIGLSIIFCGITVFGIVGLATIHVAHDTTAMKEFSDKAMLDMEIDKKPDDVFGILYIVFGLLIVIYILQVIFGSLLLYGIRRERLNLLKLWLIFKGSCIVFSVIFTIAAAITGQKRKTSGEIIIDVVSILLGQYFMFVVYQLYKEMRTRIQQRPKPNFKNGFA